MDYLNTDFDYKKVKKSLTGPSANETEQRLFINVDEGYQMMTKEYNKLIGNVKNAVFRLFKSKMTNDRSPAYRLGILLAMKDIGIQFQIKKTERLEERMKDKRIQEKRKQAILEASRQS